MNHYQNRPAQNQRIPPPVPVLQPYVQAPAVPAASMEPPPHPDVPPKKHMPDFSRFTEHFRHMDSETLLLLALLWLLYQEKADRKLLLALAYIVL